MIRITRAHIQPIGMDLGADSVKLLQLEVSNGQLSVVSAARHSLPEEARRQPELRLPAAMDVVRRLLRGRGFSGRQVITTLPREIVHVKNIRLPHMPAAELEQAIAFEARNIFPFDTEHAQVRYLHAGEVRQGSESRQELIVLAARDCDVNDFLEQVHRCGVVVESLDFEPSALYRGIERFIRRREDEQEVHVLVDIGARQSQVVIGRGREISFFKLIDVGSEHLHDAVGRKLGISVEEARSLRRRLSDVEVPDPAKRDPVRQAVYDATRSIIEDLAREISLCLRYYSVTFRGHRPSRLRLAGGEAADAQLQSILNANLPLPVEPMRTALNADTSRMKPHDRRGCLSEWSVAFGLGLKLTHGYFTDRDGKRRDASTTRETARAGSSGAEVIDLSKMMHGGAAAQRQPAPAPSQGITPDLMAQIQNAPKLEPINSPATTSAKPKEVLRA